MEGGSLGNFVQMSNIGNKAAYKANQAATPEFSQTLAHVVSRNQIVGLMPNENAQKQAFRKQKDTIEDGSEMVVEDDESASNVYKTVRKIEKKLSALARLERQSMLGF